MMKWLSMLAIVLGLIGLRVECCRYWFYTLR